MFSWKDHRNTREQVGIKALSGSSKIGKHIICGIEKKGKEEQSRLVPV